jgi:hypothetical protein
VENVEFIYVGGQRRGICFTVRGLNPIIDICPDKDINRISELFDSFDITPIAKIIEIGSWCYEQRVAHADGTEPKPPVSADTIIDMDLGVLQDVRSLTGDLLERSMRASMKVKPKKSGKKVATEKPKAD